MKIGTKGAGAAIALLCWTCMTPAGAASAPLVSDLPALSKAIAGLVKGDYRSKACNDIPDSAGRGLRPGGFSISEAGDIVAEGTRLSMFDPAASFALTKHYASRSGRPDHGFGYELFVGDKKFSLDTDLNDVKGWVEAGVHGGTRNVTEGMACPDIDLGPAKVAPESYDMAELLVPVYDTGSAFVEGECMSMAKKKKERFSARLRVGRDGVTINDTFLGLWDARNPVVMMSLGSKVGDGAINGGFAWKDGSALQMERRFGADSAFIVFGYSLPAKGEDKIYCRVRR